jgi:hypothetical protein
MIATAIGLAAYVVIGALSLAAARGLARVLGGGIGGVVAGYFTVASGEVFPPGTMQWAVSGGAYGALFGLPVAALVGGLIGLIGAVSRLLGIGHATTTDKDWPV